MDLFGYSPADLVPFSRETWYALIAAYNRDRLPAVAGGTVVGAVLLWLTAMGLRQGLRAALALLGLCWLWIAWAFLHRELGTLLWAADWLALGFATQALLLMLAALALPATGPVAACRWPAPGWWLLACALVLLPLLAWAAGRPWYAVGWFGSAPSATVIGTLGVLTLLPGHVVLPLLPLPAVWCLLSAGMLQVLGDPLWPLSLLGLCAVPWLYWHQRRAARRATTTTPPA